MKKTKKIAVLCLAVLSLLCTGCGQAVDTAQVYEYSEEAATTVSEEQLPSTEQEQTLEVQTIVQQEPDRQVSLVMVGDVLLHEKVSNSGKMPDGTYQYDHLFAQVRDDIENADLALVNTRWEMHWWTRDLMWYFMQRIMPWTRVRRDCLTVSISGKRSIRPLQC